MCDHQFSWISDLSFFPSNGVQKYGDTVFLKVLLVAADIVKTFEDDNVRWQSTPHGVANVSNM